MKDQNPFWPYLREERRTAREHLILRLRRTIARLQGKRERLVLVTSIYVVIWLIPLLVGQPLITVFALLPLVLVPPVGILIYWLVWKEFHG